MMSLNTLKEIREKAEYYELMGLLWEMNRGGCPNLFRFYFNKIKRKRVQKIAILGCDYFFLYLAEMMSADPDIEVELICNSQNSVLLKVNPNNVNFNIKYISNCDFRKIQADCYISNQNNINLKNYFDIRFVLNDIIEKNVVIRASIEYLCEYFEKQGVKAVRIEIPTQVETKNVKKFDKLTFNDIEKIFEGNKEYYNELRESVRKSQAVIRKRDRLECVEVRSRLINRMRGERIVPNQPERWDYTIHILGRCTADSTLTEDKHTIGSYLQQLFLENTDGKMRVPRIRTYGLPKVEWIDVVRNCYKLDNICRGDVVCILCENNCLDKIDVYTYKELRRAGKYAFYDGYTHCTQLGNKVYAKKIYEYLSVENGRTAKDECAVAGNVENEELNLYCENLAKYKQNLNKKRIGSIVMNCNPFTLGHYYLITTALSLVDWLYIFIVEEDKSEFRFQDRIEMVKEGVKGLDHVTVIPSGKFIISSITFPEYFVKGVNEETKIETSLDADIFGGYIAPTLGINFRFLGEEPIDNVTKQYNSILKQILPSYGIEVKIIEREKSETGDIISASKVRKALKENRWDIIEKMVPSVTYEFLAKSIM